MTTIADRLDAWPGDPSSTTLRAEWHRLRAKIARLEDAAKNVTNELENAKRDLQRVEALARGHAR